MHSPFGVQSDARISQGCDVSVSRRTSTSQRLCALPVAVRCIGGPAGTRVLSPARPIILPSGVSTHSSPAVVYYASGPGWRCTGVVVPGVVIPSIYWAVYFSPGFTISGPISATRTPPDGLQSASPIVNNQIFPSASTTLPRGPLAASTAADRSLRSQFGRATAPTTRVNSRTTRGTSPPPAASRPTAPRSRPGVSARF